MKIFFDFSLFREPHVDAQLLNIMLVIKKELRALLSDYIDRITADTGLVVVTIGPKRLNLQYFYCDDTATSITVKELLKVFNWTEVLERHLQTALN